MSNINGLPPAFESAISAAIAELEHRDAVSRIWQKDHTLWAPQPDEITDRLGWLTISDYMREQVPSINDFATNVKKDGFRHVVLLGMGGSSLGAEVLSRVFGSAAGCPRLIVLDSIVPEAVKAVAEEIDPAAALFLVSSKSGTTSEPLALFDYFYALTLSAVGETRTGRHFAAITDPATPLAEMGRKLGFRHVFLNPPDIGGRYSVLSYFGLVPAALIGVDIAGLLASSDIMRQQCAAEVPSGDSPGGRLTAFMSGLAKQGRDKLTLLASPALSAMGLWVEQLVAESTGKDGRGIVPVVAEPLVEAGLYGRDRMFAYLRLEGDDNALTDNAAEEVASAGHPLIMLAMKERYDLGAEFYRWEFAVALAGILLGINPFNQPDVQSSKNITRRLLKNYEGSGKLPGEQAGGSLSDLLSQAGEGDYFAVMAYIRQTTDTDGAFSDLRRRVLERRRIATTLGYGPRFLHSTGQLHKGGPDKGLFLQVTAEHRHDIAVPGHPYSFGIMADAQALGDLEALRSSRRWVISCKVAEGSAAALEKALYGPLT
jgi:glucose-6-phosphate isomerase/transaldolase/glucose-6-phosphate isomerase